MAFTAAEAQAKERKPKEYGATHWHVYALVAGDRPFYIGCTISPRKRTYQHKSDPGSAGYHRSNWELVVLETFNNRDAARAYESYLVASLPGLVNRPLIGNPHGFFRVRRQHLLVSSALTVDAEIIKKSEQLLGRWA
jgi:predicted GIY-YIG superfamily endonuclease